MLFIENEKLYLVILQEVFCGETLPSNPLISLIIQFSILRLSVIIGELLNRSWFLLPPCAPGVFFLDYEIHGSFCFVSVSD